jgi:hypothetical protein
MDSSFNDWTFVILASFCSDFLFLRSTETFAQNSKITKVRIQKIDPYSSQQRKTLPYS